MKTYQLKNGVQLYHLETDKFKTFSISVYLYREMNEADATKNALLPQVLRSATEKYPSRQKIYQYLEWLYGAKMAAGIRKKGDAAVMAFCFEALSDDFVEKSLAPDLSDLALEVLYHPHLESGAFCPEILKIEKQNLKDRIQAMINEKREYATERCIEEMCKGEPYGIYELGKIDDIDPITPSQLYAHYKKVIQTSKIDVFVSGKVDIQQIIAKFEAIPTGTQLPVSKRSEIRKEPKVVEEEMDVAQGKLVIGMKTTAPLSGKEYYDLLLFNSVYGGGVHSKLFNNVREKLSLAYYVYSRLVRSKGIILVGTGIEFDKYESAKQEIFHQLDEIKQGNLSEEELDAAKLSLINAYRSLNDSPASLEDFYLGQILLGSVETIEEAISQIEAVKLEDVIQTAHTVSTDTIYFLKGKGQA